MCACTDFSATHMEDLLSTCQREVSKNMTYYTFNADTGRFEPPAILDLICPVNCMDRGECVDGEAICYMTSFLRCCKVKQSASVYVVEGSWLMQSDVAANDVLAH